ncbi:hypothetical protein MMC10_000374 [Thelotrema lepadinum]|nr:hypothetical protein [Thelotrema lepadinum]
MQSGPEAIQPTPATFNNFACSGNTFQQIMDKELLDSPEFDSLYGTGPAWGKNPEFVTMTMGGNDIGILNLVATCIFSFKFSLGIFFDCDQVIQHGHDIIEGRNTAVGPAFPAFVTGKNNLSTVHPYRTAIHNATLIPTRLRSILQPRNHPVQHHLLQALVGSLPSTIPSHPTPHRYEQPRPRPKSSRLHRRLLLQSLSKRALRRLRRRLRRPPLLRPHRTRTEPAPDDPDTFFNWYTRDDPNAQALFEQMPAYQDSLTNNPNPDTTYFQSDADYLAALAAVAGTDASALTWLTDAVSSFHPSSLGHQAISDMLEQAIASAGVIMPVFEVVPASSALTSTSTTTPIPIPTPSPSPSPFVSPSM